ncbi:hypothetical protein [Flavobacterium sp. AG291]|uniref:hypothetical protein n=1 Tax=Flavobacterium sp. AG291 TaxID=2184000 RepID=UPI000E0C4C5A|nr:hypothetical protein [Flavobacterium sp. AG291]RDI07058.1 hypothetical protein DEU42_113158 [Flavobacterium sp. AG291]
MSMKTYFIIILVIIAACSSTDTDPVATPLPEPVTAEPEDIIPDWLIGNYQSRWFPTSTNISIITEASIVLNLNDFSNINQPYPLTYNLLIENVATEVDERHLTLILDNGINITFRKNDDPSVSDITIEINERHFGWFKKLD